MKVVEDAKGRAPKDTGAMARGIRRSVSAKKLTATISAGARWAELIPTMRNLSSLAPKICRRSLSSFPLAVLMKKKLVEPCPTHYLD